MILQKFLDQVSHHPDKTALKVGELSFTYQCVHDMSNRVAHRLRRENIRIAALLIGHDEGMIFAIFGSLRARVVYSPFDPTYPRERLKYMLNDSNADAIVTNSENIGLAEELARQAHRDVAIINIDEPGAPVSSGDSYTPRRAEEAAYILYTSGSTGKPKGTVQTVGNILYYIQNWIRRFRVRSVDRIAQFASFSHDGAVPDVFSSLLKGATLLLFDVKRRANIEAPAQWLVREHITVWHSVPTWYRYFAGTLTGKEVFPYLRLVILGGEAVREHDIILFQKHFKYSTFGNIYGQTESTVSSIWLLNQEDQFQKILIGEPSDRTEILVVDDEGDEVGELETGEIVLAGPSLSPGYINRIDATHHVFASDEELVRLYWTGDLGRLLPDGNIEILGRKDHQVKVRGFRIEPGEIETVLLHHPHIQEAVVVARESSGSTYGTVSGDRYLWAYLTSPKELTVHELREHLSQSLPDYMIPAYFVQLQKMPLTPTGKIDRKSLDVSGKRLGTGTTYSPPENETEKQLITVWKDILKVDQIGIDDNFFDLGGNSMDVINLTNDMQTKFNRTIPPATIFQHLTIRTFARYLDQSTPVTQTIDRTEEIKKSKQRIMARKRRLKN